MSFLDIFSSKNGERTIDAIIDSGDVIFYTEEEKARARQLGMETKLKMLQSYSAFKLAQRYIAFTIVINFFLSFWLGVGLFLASSEFLDGYLRLVGIFNLGWIMIAVVSFYFGGGFVESFKKFKEGKEN